jgi:ubiquitin-protein ligase
MSSRDNWDPDSEGPSASPPSKSSRNRMVRDVKAIFEEPLAGILVFPTHDVKHVWALISGPEGTPYEAAPFLLKVVFPSSGAGEYPLVPPKVRLLTTGGGTVRFGPNLYDSGKVCLSILGTWSGPSWLPAQNLGTVLLSIQSLMGVDAARNEPGREQASEGEVKKLNDVLAHETLRVAVLEQTRAALAALAAARSGSGGGGGDGGASGGGASTASAGGAPPSLSVLPLEVHEAVVENFRDLWEAHRDRAKALAALDGQPFEEPSVSLVVGGIYPRRFRFAALAGEIEKLAAELPSPRVDEEGDGAAGGGGGGGGEDPAP